MTDVITIKTKRIFHIKNIWIYIVLLIFFKPQIAEDFHLFDLLFNAGRIALTLWYTSALIIKNKRIKKPWLYLCIEWIAVLALTLLNHGIISKAISHYLPSIGMLSFFIYNKKKIYDVCNCFVRMLSVLLLMNLVSFVLFPNGLALRDDGWIPVWLLGQKQDLAGIVFPFVFFSLLVFDYDSHKKVWIVYRAFGLSLLTLLLEQSIAATICFAGCMAVCILTVYLPKKITRKIDYKKMTLGIVLAFAFSQIIAYNFDDMPFIKGIVESINTRGISKTRTLFLRFGMWKFGWKCFFDSPLFGKGELSNDAWVNGIGYYHSIMDNIYMDIIATGGLLGMTLFVVNTVKAMKYLSSNRRRALKYASYCLFALCLYSFTGSPFVPPVFLMFTASSWLPYLENGRIKNILTVNGER